MLVRQVQAQGDGCRLIAADRAAGSAAVGQDAGELAGIGALGVAVGDDPVELFAKPPTR